MEAAPPIDVDLCVYSGPVPATDLVACAELGAGLAESIEVRKQDGVGPDDTTVFVGVFQVSGGASSYVLRILGDVDTAIPPNLG